MSFFLRRSLPIAILGLAACLVTPVLAQKGKKAPASIPMLLKIVLKPGAKWDAKSFDFAKVISRNGNVLTVQLDPEQGLARQAGKLKKGANVASMVALQPVLPVDIKERKASEMGLLLKEYREAYGVYREFGEPGALPVMTEKAKKGGARLESEETDIPGLDFLQAYQQWKQLRSFPNDDIDHEAYAEVYRQKLRNSEAAAGRTPDFTSPRALAGVGVGGEVRANSTRIIGTGGGGLGVLGWEFLGPKNLNVPYTTYFGQRASAGRINAVAYDPRTTSTMYAGSPGGALFKTLDSGTTWTPLGDKWPIMGVSSIAVSPADSTIVLAGTGDFPGFDTAGVGIMRTTDGGATWTSVANALTGSNPVSGIVFDPETNNVVTATVYGGGIIQSTDSGATWTTVNNASTSYCSLSMGFKRLDGSRTLWAGGPTLRQSSDRGMTWTVNGTIPVGGQKYVAASKLNANTAYVLATGAQKIYKTTDNGVTWTDITGGFPAGNGNNNWSQAWYDYHINTSTNTNGATVNETVFVGLVDIVMSRDGGSSWRNAGGAGFTATYSGTAITHNDQHCLAVNPKDPNEVMVGNDGGLYKAVYDPVGDKIAWTTTLNSKLYVTQFYTMDAFPNDNTMVLGGTQDNASPTSYPDRQKWNNVVGGDGAGCAINPFDPFTQYGSSQFNNISRTTTAWADGLNISPDFTGQSVPFIGKLWLDPNDGQSLYCNTNFLNRYNAGTDMWDLELGGIVPLSPSGLVNAVAVAPGNSRIIVAGTTDGLLWRSGDFGASFQRIDGNPASPSPLPNRGITSVTFNGNQGSVLVTVSGSGSGHLYSCSDITAANPIWNDLSGTGPTSLPNISANALVRDIDNPATIWWVGTDVGIYRTTNGGATWADMGALGGFPNVQVDWMVAKPGSRTVFAATFGRGIWRFRSNGLKVASLSFDKSSLIGGTNLAGIVTLDSEAPVSGTVVTLSSSNPAVITVPASVKVPYDSAAVNFTAVTHPVTTDTVVTVTATLGSQTTTVPITVRALGDYYATSVLFDNAINIGGIVEYTKLADNIRLIYRVSDTTTKTCAAIFSSEATRVSAPNTITIQFKGQASSRVPVTGVFRIYNYSYRRWDVLGSAPLVSRDQVLNFSVTAKTYDYMAPKTGVIQVRIEGTVGTSTNFPWSIGIDQLLFRLN